MVKAGYLIHGRIVTNPVECRRDQERTAASQLANRSDQGMGLSSCQGGLLGGGVKIGQWLTEGPVGERDDRRREKEEQPPPTQICSEMGTLR